MFPRRTVVLALMLALAICAAAQDHGFPIPEGARKNDSLGGATTLATGRNYTVVVYEVDAAIDSIVDFYAGKLPDATRDSDAHEVRFATAGGTVRLARSQKGTRITLLVGPQ
jgi:hypothetical protein